MAFIDTKRDVLVVRIVYDGLGMSGKTTTMSALAKGLGAEITSPEEQDGRTLFFDWIDYVGGLYEGRKIRCQIVSVPGQIELAERRQVLLDSADAVIFVADTRKNKIKKAYQSLRKLVPQMRTQSPPVGIVVQANKRDHKHSTAMQDIRSEIRHIGQMAVIETVATDSLGIREAFVFGVRLALDRVRVLADVGRLPEYKDMSNAKEELHASLLKVKAPKVLPKSSTVDVDWFDEEFTTRPDFHPPTGQGPRPVHSGVDTEQFRVPNPMMPSGFIWPPVDGRTLLFEFSKLALQPERTAQGDWCATGAGWRFHSVCHSKFDNAEDARKALVTWARLHVSSLDILSEDRVVILSESGEQSYRLWQLVRVEESLREQLVASQNTPVRTVAARIHNIASELLKTREKFEANNLHLPCTLWTVGLDKSKRGVYVGLMPAVEEELEEELSGTELVEREFRPVLRSLEREFPKFQDVAATLQRKVQSSKHDVALETLVQMTTCMQVRK